MILLFTSNNVASAGIAKKLVAGHGFAPVGENEWRCGETRLIDTKAPSVLEVPCDLDTDCLIVLSTHKSKTAGKMLTAHVPGNWAKAEMGGEPNTLNIAPASVLKNLVIALKKEADAIGWPLSMEADHHGPTGNTPIIFVEIGSTENEWGNEEAAEAVARAVVSAIESKKRYETVLGVGGGHYAKRFLELELEKENGIALGHMAPKYVLDGLDEKMFRQAVEKNVERISKVIILKDETSRPQKDKIGKFAQTMGIKCEIV